jgi:hypothetical protein
LTLRIYPASVRGRERNLLHAMPGEEPKIGLALV